MNNKLVKKIGNILTILSLGFIVYRLYKMDIDFSLYSNFWKTLLYIVSGTIFIVIGIAANSYAWKRMLEAFSKKKVMYLEAYYIYSKANIGKYLPGNVMHYVERNIFAAKCGIGQLETLCCSVSEIIGQIVTATILSLFLARKELISFLENNLNHKLLIAGCILLLVCVAVLCVLCKKSEKIKTVISQFKSKDFAKVFISNIFVYIISFVTSGLTLMLSLNLINSEIQANSISLLFAINTMAWLIGFIIPGVPGGIGVRELVLTTMAAGTQYADVILVAAVGQRVVSVIGDFIAYLAGEFTNKQILKRKGE